MIIITSDYRSVGNPEMGENFIIRPDKVNKVWDITDHKIGISFIPTYDKYEYEIELEATSKHLLAKDILNMVTNNLDTTIIGIVKIR